MSAQKKLGRGGASNTKQGAKPPHAYELEQRARTNIEQKLKVLIEAIKLAQAASGSLPTGFPTSRRQFNFWTPNVANGVVLSINANATLFKHKDLLKSVIDSTAVAKALANTLATQATAREVRLASALRTQRIHWVLRTIAERAAVSARRELANAKKEVVLLQAASRSASNEFHRALEELRAENRTLRADNARLVRELSGLVSLRRKK